GRTLVVVTHDDAVAARAERVINLKDGLIDRDIRNGKDQPKAKEKPQPAIITSIQLSEEDLQAVPAKEKEDDEKIRVKVKLTRKTNNNPGAAQED
ncbi:MAG: hypothetical protein CMO66_01365, partial [Verrucomicrobiales bacterium]|nr:hypothetical protein [Verrucomicrobiales bacterium]